LKEKIALEIKEASHCGEFFNDHFTIEKKRMANMRDDFPGFLCIYMGLIHNDNLV